jgi:CBS domain-containing protein
MTVFLSYAECFGGSAFPAQAWRGTMRISDILRSKGDRVVTVTPDTTVEQLLAVLAEHRIGAVVVSAAGTSVDGIVSERDVVRALAARGAPVLSEKVTAILTAEVRTVEPQAELADVERLMTEHRFRHVPVVTGGALRGLVSIGDVVKHRIDELETERSELTGYITGDRY